MRECARGMRGMSASGAVYHPPLGRLVTKQPKRFAGVARPHLNSKALVSS